MQITIAMIDNKKNSFDLSSEEVCNDFALSGLVLSYFVSEGAAFVHSCRSSSGSDQITSHAEALYPEKCGFPLHRIGDVTGLGVTTSDAILASYTPTFCPLFSLSPQPRVCPICPFLGLTYDPTGLLRLSLAQNNFVSE